jgi:hypothetical protein
MAVRIGYATLGRLMTSTGNARQVLIAGAGVAALEAALALQALAEDEVSVELVAPEAEFTYRPLAVTEPFGVGEAKRFPLQRLAEAAGARLRTGSVAAVDPERKIVTLENGQELSYEILLLALGAQPREAIAGALTFRGPQDGPALSALLDPNDGGRDPPRRVRGAHRRQLAAAALRVRASDRRAHDRTRALFAWPPESYRADEAWRNAADTIDAARFPRQHQVARHAARLRWKDVWESGLDLLLNGLRARLEKTTSGADT